MHRELTLELLLEITRTFLKQERLTRVDADGKSHRYLRERYKEYVPVPDECMTYMN